MEERYKNIYKTIYDYALEHKISSIQLIELFESDALSIDVINSIENDEIYIEMIKDIISYGRDFKSQLQNFCDFKDYFDLNDEDDKIV